MNLENRMACICLKLTGSSFHREVNGRNDGTHLGEGWDHVFSPGLGLDPQKK
jgi:hypothetical protein